MNGLLHLNYLWASAEMFQIYEMLLFDQGFFLAVGQIGNYELILYYLFH